MLDLQTKVEAAVSAATDHERLELFRQVATALDNGLVRVAEPMKSGWKVNAWVKQAILWGFKYGVLEQVASNAGFNFFDKNTLPLKQLNLTNKVRVAPGGSAIRHGAYVAPGAIIMPPSYINIGAYIGENTLVDSHVLVGSGAQIGCGVHLAAGVQIGGVLEPVGSLPVIVEDDAFIGGSCGIYEGVVIKKGAVIASGVILNHAIQVYDLPNNSFIKAASGYPLTIPANAVVVPGSRPLTSSPAPNIQISCPVIVKYRDAKTDRSLELESALRT